MEAGVSTELVSAWNRLVFCHCRVIRQSCFVILSSPKVRFPFSFFFFLWRGGGILCACTVLAALEVSRFEYNWLRLGSLPHFMLEISLLCQAQGMK